LDRSPEIFVFEGFGLPLDGRPIGGEFDDTWREIRRHVLILLVLHQFL
jgi:hypothetical protein